MSGSVIAISGIDTGIGKTYVTGLLAKALLRQGKKVITQKIVQTGCEGIAEDILEHRRLMGIDLQDADREGLTCPSVLRYPASPHLSARLESVQIDLCHISRSTLALQQRYDLVLLEGVGGLLVPLASDLLFADYIRDAGYGLLLVTSPRLGSINHTLLSIEACVRREIVIRGVIYNCFQDTDKLIADDTREVILHYLNKAGFAAPVINLREGLLDPDAAALLSL
ncbi:MAG: ATP-dependent dethiobiotin synthetase BioD [Chlorobiaceae bacterium]|nr:ATP-dependent dethiobiotin synthetase BioD [Chlorobiaceae bacterium]NTV16421.1 ATP-dependent dethiobiotin synthetase BioD [Chlorobiaceae bacterium]